jgi:hypothetical protein
MNPCSLGCHLWEGRNCTFGSGVEEVITRWLCGVRTKQGRCYDGSGRQPRFYRWLMSKWRFPGLFMGDAANIYLDGSALNQNCRVWGGAGLTLPTK